MKLSRRILMAVMVLALAGLAAGQTEQNQVNDVKIGRAVEIREAGRLQNLDEFNQVDALQVKTVQLYRAADEVISASVEGGEDQVVYTLELSSGQQKRIPVEQLAASPLVRGIKNLEELAEFDGLRIFDELKTTDGLKIIAPVSEKERGIPDIYVTQSLEGGTDIARPGQEIVEVVIFGKDSKERAFAVGCTVRPEQIRRVRIEGDEKADRIETRLEQDQKAMVAKFRYEQQQKHTKIEEQLEKLKAELDKLEKTSAQKEKRAALEDEIKQLEAILKALSIQVRAEDEANRDYMKALNFILAEQAQKEKKEQEEYQQKKDALLAALAEARAGEDEKKAREILNLLDELRQKQAQEEAQKAQARNKYLAEMDTLQKSLAIKKAAEQQQAELEQSLLDRVRVTQEQAIQQRAARQLALTQQNRPPMPKVETTTSSWAIPAATPRARRAADSEVLVIPVEGPMTAEQLGTTVENMEIMRRIFERKLQQAGLIVKGGESPFGAAEFYILSGLSPSRTGTKRPPQSMYLQGYGALFFLNVDYPLLGPEAKIRKAAPPPARDELWDQVKKELKAVKKELKAPPGRIAMSGGLFGGGGRITSLGYGLEEDVAAVKEYVEAKVEKLKETLLETLVHASNMSHLGEDEWIVIHVTGTSRPTVIEAAADAEIDTVADADKDVQEAKAVQVLRSSNQRGAAAAGVPPRRAVAGVPPQQLTLPAAQHFELVPGPAEAAEPTHMVIRASKDDINRLARETISFESFKERVKIFIY